MSLGRGRAVIASKAEEPAQERSGIGNGYLAGAEACVVGGSKGRLAPGYERGA